MNAERLLEFYEQINEAPGAVLRLRRYVLDLAVRGKLVEQDAGDEPAVELLKRIEQEKMRLIKLGEIKKGKPLPPLKIDDAPFIVPTGWHLTRLGTVIELLSGQHLQPPEYSETPGSGVPYITGPSDFLSDSLSITRFALVRKAVAREGQLLLTVKGSGVGKTTICTLPEVAISRQLMSLTPIVWAIGFLELITHRLAVSLQSQARSLIPGIARRDVEEFVFPLPPLAEQHRIVAKVDELMALCDQLELARAGREAVRDRLTAASLARLTAPDTDAEAFKSYARFALQSLPTLTTRPDQIKTLRQTVLNLAVRGKLVAQIAGDEPAFKLLARIKVEREGLILGGATRKSKQLPPMSREALSVELPIGWEWSRPDDISTKITDGEHFRPPTVDKGIFFLSAKDVREDGVSLVDPLFVSEETAKKARLRCDPDFGDLLIVSRGATCGRICRVNINDTFCLLGSVILIKPSSNIDNRYLEFALRSPQIFAELISASGATAQGAIYLRDLKKIPLPLPPIAEQHRIVAKVDALMALCDQLENSLTTTATTRSKLLNALLHEALEPAAETADA